METQLKNTLSLVEVKKMAWYLFRIFVIGGLILAVSTISGLDLSKYPTIVQILLIPACNWVLEWLNQYKKEVRL
jgi:hypothetical protein